MIRSAWDERIARHIRAKIVKALTLRNRVAHEVPDVLTLGDVLSDVLDKVDADNCIIVATNLMDEVVK